MGVEEDTGVEASMLPELKTPVPPGASLADRAYYELRDRIVSVRIPPGHLIREDALMEELGMSRTPIREALLRLAQERLVRIMPRRGTFVTAVHVGEIRAIYEFRRELEAVAARWAAERRQESDLPLLSEAIDSLSAAAASSPSFDIDPRSLIVADQSVHELIYSVARNPIVKDVLDSYYYLALRTWFLASSKVQMDEPFKYLAELLEAIMRGDPDASAMYVRQHNKYAESVIREAL